MVEDARELLSENVRHYRCRNNLSRRELSEKAHISEKHLASIEGGTSFVSYTSVCQIAKALDVSLSSLFYTEAEREGKEDAEQKVLEKYVDSLKAGLGKKD